MFSSIGSTLSSLWPFGSSLGHSWADTQEKVENIYRDTHHSAQRRVEALKEHSLKDQSDLQHKIAEIYREAAEEAEQRIDRLKRPIMAMLRKRRDEAVEEPSVMGRAKDAAMGYFGKKAVHDEPTVFEDTTKKISQAYRDAIAKAQAALPEMVKGEPLVETKSKLRRLYDEAFHRSHGETRTMFGRLRDMLGWGVHAAADVGKSAAITTWHLLAHAVMGVFWLSLGAAASTWLMWFWNKRKFNRQLNSHVPGPVTLQQEYLVVGNEDVQRKFFDYWTNTGNAYFSRQPGLRKSVLHRGIDALNNKWVNLAEWSSVEELRRAMATPEFIDLKRRAPVNVIPMETLYQVSAVGGRSEGDIAGKGAMHEGLRQRTTGPGVGTTTPIVS